VAFDLVWDFKIGGAGIDAESWLCRYEIIISRKDDRGICSVKMLAYQNIYKFAKYWH
jgi:hypothetical protein